ncbi:hypothetical protein MRX96_053427 [Rhipicephalus microplus]
MDLERLLIRRYACSLSSSVILYESKCPSVALPTTTCGVGNLCWDIFTNEVGVFGSLVPSSGAVRDVWNAVEWRTVAIKVETETGAVAREKAFHCSSRAFVRLLEIAYVLLFDYPPLDVLHCPLRAGAYADDPAPACSRRRACIRRPRSWLGRPLAAAAALSHKSETSVKFVVAAS